MNIDDNINNYTFNEIQIDDDKQQSPVNTDRFNKD